MIDNERECGIPNEETVDEAVKTEGTADKAEKKAKKSSKEVKELKEAAEKYQKLYEEINDKYLRMIAEYDNFRRRSKEEKDATYENAMSDTVAQLLPMITTKPFIERPKQFYQIRGCNTIQFRVMRKVSLYLEF